MSNSRNCNSFFEKIILKHVEFQNLVDKQSRLPEEAGQLFLTPVSPQAIADRKQYEEYGKQMTNMSIEMGQLLEEGQQCRKQNSKSFFMNKAHSDACQTLFKKCITTPLIIKDFDSGPGEVDNSNYCMSKLDQCLQKAFFKNS